MSLFKQDIDPMCVYCAFGQQVSSQEVICPKKGLMAPYDSCRKFQYDPLRRVPPRPKKADFSKLKKEDFSI